MRTVFLLAYAGLLTAAASAQLPSIANDGVRNAASYASGLTVGIAPQMLVTIFGSSLASGTATATGTTWPISLAGTSVTFNGIVAPLTYVSPGQINAQVPTGVAGSASAQVVVRTAAGPGAPAAVTVVPMALGIFTQDGSGCGRPAAFNVHADGSLSLNTPQNSLEPTKDLGLAVFLTGLGAIADRVDGQPWPFNSSEQNFQSPGGTLGLPGLNTYGIQMRSAYSGGAPGLIGVDQVNLLLPNALNNAAFLIPIPEGCKLPLFLEGPASASQAVNVSIHSGGGACVDPPPDSFGKIVWQKQIVSDTVPSSSDSVAFTFYQGAAVEPYTPALDVRSGFFFEAGEPIAADNQPQILACQAALPTPISPGPLAVSIGAEKFTTGPFAGAYTFTLPSGSIQSGTSAIAGAGDGTVGAFTISAPLPEPIHIATSLVPGTVIAFPFTLTWTGASDNTVVGVVLEFPPSAAHPLGFSVSSGAMQTAGSLTFSGMTGGEWFTSTLPSGPLEIVVTQSQPALTLFSIPGLTLGGDETANYTWDFRGLTVAP